MIQPRPFSKYLFSLLIFVLTISPSFIPKNASASHIMGGEITAAHISGTTSYELNLVLYRDIQGIAIPQSVTFTISNSGGAIGTVMATLDSSFLDTMTIGNNLVGFEAAYFKSAAYSFPGTGTYLISWNSCCRNAVILNCLNPGSQSIHLETMLTIPATGVNSTPVYLAAPVSYVAIDSAWQHNPMPFDVDGDSLAWSIDTPWTFANTLIPGYITPSAHPGGSFSINALTGEISWTPNMLGNFIATVMVEEFRGGVKIGQIRRDMQFIVIPDSILSSPRIGNFNTFPTDANGNAKIILSPGTPYNVTLNASDAQNNNILFTSYGESYMLQTNAASFTSNAPIPGQATGTFSWTPISSQARINPYLVSFRVSNGLMAYDETLIIEVGNFTSTQNGESSSVGNSYPNPTQNIFFVPFELKSSADVQFELFDIIGNKVADDVVKYYANGQHTEKFNMDFPTGIYFIRISIDGKLIKSQKFILN